MSTMVSQRAAEWTAGFLNNHIDFSDRNYDVQTVIRLESLKGEEYDVWLVYKSFTYDTRFLSTIFLYLLDQSKN